MKAYCGIGYGHNLESGKFRDSSADSTEKINLISALLNASKNGDLIAILETNVDYGDDFKNQFKNSGNDRLAKSLVKFYGTAIYLAEMLRFSLLPTDPYISPLLTDEETLRKFPKTYFLVS